MDSELTLAMEPCFWQRLKGRPRSGRTSQGKKRGLRAGPDWRPLPGQAEAVHESGPALGRVWEPSVTKSRPLQAHGAGDVRGLSPQASHVGGSSVVVHGLSV